jgi:hypothetical protein
MKQLVTWQSWWIWQYWINQKSYTWDDVTFIIGNYIKIHNKSLDHGELFVKVDKVVIGLMFWNFIGTLLNMFLGYLEVAT